MKQLNLMTFVLFFFMTHIIMSAVFVHADLPQTCAHETATVTTDTLPHTDFDGKEKGSLLSCLSCSHCFHFLNQITAFVFFQKETIPFTPPQNERMALTYLTIPQRPPRV